MKHSRRSEWAEVAEVDSVSRSSLGTTAFKILREGLVLPPDRAHPKHISSVVELASANGQMIRVDDEWHSLVHGESTNNRHLIWRKLIRLLEHPLQSSSCPSIIAEVHRHVSHGVLELGPVLPISSFPGPMACPLLRRSKGFLHNNPVWLTEKSDGLRAMLYMKAAHAFPRWFIDKGAGFEPLGLYDSTLLEMAYEAVVGSDKKKGNSRIPLSLHTQRRDDDFAMLLEDGKAMLISADDRKIPLHRRMGNWCFGYIFDRSNDVFMFLEEMAIPVGIDPRVRKPSPLSEPPMKTAALLDGELIYNYKLKQITYYMYDIALLQDPQRQPVYLGLSRMEERAHAIVYRVAEPFHWFHKLWNRRIPLMLVRKRFWPRHEIKELLGSMQRDGNTVLYKQQNETDGVVISPDSPALFPFTAGTCPSLLKWKFPHLLTVDWHIQLVEDSSPRKFQLSFLLKDRTKDREWKEMHIPYKICPLQATTPLNLGLGKAVIGECRFEPSGFWRVIQIRPDKRQANSYLTISSVLESMLENLDAAALVHTLLHPGAVPYAPRPVKSSDLHSVSFVLRTVKDKEKDKDKGLMLQSRIQTPLATYPRSYNYISVAETFGLGCKCPKEDSTSALIPWLYIQLANAGGCRQWSDCVVTAKFHPASGRWQLLSVMENSNKNSATLKRVLKHLEGALEGNVCSEEEFVFPKTTIDSIGTAQHYGERALLEEDEVDRGALRRFNNWVKSVLICSFSQQALPSDHRLGPEGAENIPTDRNFVVVDLCCGRGGDLMKWRAMKPTHYVGIDSSLVAVSVAASRYVERDGLSVKTLDNPGFRAAFVVQDCFHPNCLVKIRESLDGKGDAHCVSCQFSIHYAFGAEASVRAVLETVSNVLRAGGVFIGTTVDSVELLRRRKELGPQFGNNEYKVTFSSTGDDIPLYGAGYRFTLGNSVDDTEEYVLHWDNFVRVAGEYGLQLVESRNFREVFENYSTTELGTFFWEKLLAKTAKTAPRASRPQKRPRTDDDVTDDQEGLTPTSPNLTPTAAPETPRETQEVPQDPITGLLSEDEAQAAFLYRTFVFVKAG